MTEDRIDELAREVVKAGKSVNWAIRTAISEATAALHAENERHCETCDLTMGENCFGMRCDECYSKAEFQAKFQRERAEKAEAERDVRIAAAEAEATFADEFRERAEAAEADASRLREVLREIRDEHCEYCPICGRHNSDPCKPDCRLAAVLRPEQPPQPSEPKETTMDKPDEIDGKKVIGRKPPRYFMWPGEALLASNETFKEYMEKRVRKERPPLKPSVLFSREGNYFECWWGDSAFFAEDRGDLTFYLDMETREIVGVQFHAVTSRMGLIECSNQTATGGESASEISAAELEAAKATPAPLPADKRLPPQNEASPEGHCAVEAACVHHCLDDRDVPRKSEDGRTLSLWGRVVRWSASECCSVGRAVAARADPTEKDRRVYYQDIVYAVCNALNRIFVKRPHQGVVCGTVETPSKQVQEHMAIVVERCIEVANRQAAEQAGDEPTRADADTSMTDAGKPAYIVWSGFRDWKVCNSLVQALEWKRPGWLIYEPMGMTTAVKVSAELAHADPNRGRVVRDAYGKEFVGGVGPVPWESSDCRDEWNRVFDAVEAKVLAKRKE